MNKKAIYILLTVVLFFLLIGINFLGVRFDFRFDLTKAQQHTLNKTTLDAIRKLHQTVTITVFHVGIPPQYLQDILNEYARNAGGHIQTEIVDPLVSIGYAAQFGSVISGEEKKAIVRTAKEREDVDFKNKSLSEGMLTNAILKTTRPERKIYFLTGHEEYDIDNSDATGLSILKNTLANNNCSIRKLMLGIEKQIPKDCDLLIIAGTKIPLTAKEEEILRNYLEGGGKALFLIESLPVGDETHPLKEEDKAKNPSFSAILERWGLLIGDDIVVDLENYIGQDVGCPVTKNYPPHKEIVSDLGYTFYIRPRSITIKPNFPKDVKIAPLVITASKEKSWGETNRMLQVKFEEGADKPGPIILAAVVWGPKSEKRPQDTKIIVVTDCDFITNTFIGQYSNAQMALNSIRWLTDVEDFVVLNEKPVQVERLDLTNQQSRAVIVILAAMPIFIIVIGFILSRQNNPKG